MKIFLRKRDYLISTIQGSIPYIIDDTKPFLQVNRKILLDDFVYKDSFYAKNGDMNIKKYTAVSVNPYVCFKEISKVLKSKRGNYKLKQEDYHEIVKKMNPAGYAAYDNSTLTINGEICVEPKDFCDFKKIIETETFLVGTDFVNKLIIEGKILQIKNNELKIVDINKHDDEYLKYIFSINEINALTTISEINYKAMFDYFNILNK